MVSPAALQFGHGVEAVDEPKPPSEGPQTCGLQFGHGVDAVDDKNGNGPKRRPIEELQFGHGVEAVDDAPPDNPPPPPEDASIRPRR